MTVNCQLRMPNQAVLYEHIKSNAKHAKRMATFDSRKGRSLIICGAGPSMAAVDSLPRSDEVWACNSALPYLMDRGFRVTHGFTIDQGAEMLGPAEWERTFNLRYYVSSSVHPSLVEHLLAQKRRLTFFHSFLGLSDPEGYTPVNPGESYEMWLYRNHYQTSVQVGHGLNSVPRAACLAIAMGFKSIALYGADCAAAPNYLPMPEYGTPEYAEWMAGLVLYADGRSAAQSFGALATMAEAPDIDGRRWHTRPDMVISAQHLLDLKKAYPSRITLHGDTLPNALRDKSEDFMQDLPELSKAGEVTGFGMAHSPTEQQEEMVA